jgi:hypothetical protein
VDCSSAAHRIAARTLFLLWLCRLERRLLGSNPHFHGTHVPLEEPPKQTHALEQSTSAVILGNGEFSPAADAG